MSRLLPFLVAGWLCAALAAQGSLPKPSGRVTDLANVIDPATEAQIDQRLAALEQQTTAEVAVVTVPSLGGTTVEDYAERLFRDWGIGQAKHDNGVLVLVAPTEREIRIEVGYGLEGVLPDGLAGQVIREQFIPRFRDNDYDGGIRDGVARVVEIVERGQTLTADELAALDADADGGAPPAWIMIPFLGLFVTIGFAMVGIGARTRTGFPLLFGGFFGGLPLLLALVLLTWVASITLLPLAVIMTMVGYLLGGRDSWRQAFRDSGGGGSRGSSSGWVMGGGSHSRSGSSSRSRSSSNGFGGGRSGGGGASGKW